MRDILTDIYNVLKNDEFINKYVNVDKNITFNRYPEIESVTAPHIVIDDIDEPLPEEYADDDNLGLNYLVQIDVYTKVQPGVNARILRNELSYRISRLLKDKLNMTNTSNAKPEYDDELKFYRSARRYEGTFYRKKLK